MAEPVILIFATTIAIGSVGMLVTVTAFRRWKRLRLRK